MGEARDWEARRAETTKENANMTAIIPEERKRIGFKETVRASLSEERPLTRDYIRLARARAGELARAGDER